MRVAFNVTPRDLVRPVVLLAMFLLGMPPASAGGAVLADPIVVDTGVDEADPTGGNWSGCGTIVDSNDCSLREAINGANSVGGTQTIVFEAGITSVTLTQPYTDDDTYGNGDLDITTPMIIEGAGVAVTGNGVDRVFEIGDATEVTIRGLTVGGGDPAGVDPGDNDGGGIFVNSGGGGALNVLLDGVTIAGNTSPDDGGGLGSVLGDSDTLTIQDSTISGNTAVQDGGGLDHDFTGAGQVTITNSTITGNSLASSGSDDGGGVFINGGDFGTATVTIQNSTISGNHSPFDDGGGIGVEAGAILNVTNSTISGNTALEDGGGLYAVGTGTSVTITGSTISQNHAWRGGGIFNADGGTLNITNTLIADNVADQPGGEGRNAGGGILTSGSSPAATTTVTQSVIRGNTAGTDSRSGVGGGLAAFDGIVTISQSAVHNNAVTVEGSGGGMVIEGAPDVQVLDSTISGNTAAGGGSAIDFFQFSTGSPGFPCAAVCLWGSTIVTTGTVPGISVFSDSGAPLEFANSIVQGGPGDLCSGSTILSRGGNSFGDATCPSNAGLGDVTSTQTLGALAPLDWTPADGPTLIPTHELLSGAEGVDQLPAANTPVFAQQSGPQIACSDADARGTSRDQDGDNDGTPGCDRGAHERIFVPATTGTTVTPGSAELTITKTAPAEAAVGDTITFSIAASNGGSAPASSTVITDQVPAASFTVTGASAPCTVAGNDVTCGVGTLAAGSGSATVTITVTVDAEGALTNEACVDSATAEGNTTDNCATSTTTVAPVETTRVEGPERITTAVAGSQAAFADGAADAVVITRQDDFPDAQAGTPLAVDRNAPLLLSQTSMLSEATEVELLRVLPAGGPVYLLGGALALSQAVEDRVAGLGYQPIRLRGANRYATAVAIAEEIGEPGTLLLADGGTFGEAIVAGAASTQVDGAVLLTAPSSVPVETQTYLDSRGATVSTIAIGATSPALFPDAEAVSGGDASALSVAVAARFFSAPVAVGVATGQDFADALVGGTVVNSEGVGPGPILLTDPSALPEVLRAYLEASAVDLERLFVFGGPAAIDPAVEDEINTALGL